SQSSWIRKMFEDGVRLKKEYGAENVFDFSLGNPDVSPPERFKEILREIIDEDLPAMHSYMPNAGFPDVRSKVAAYMTGEHNVEMTADNIIMTCGAGGALNVVFKTLLDPGDEVIIPTPFFVEYRFYLDNFGGVPQLVKTKNDFSLDLDIIKGAISERAKAVLINSPNNPTGKVYDEESIKGLSAILEEKSAELGKDIYLISDEPYRDIVYDGVKVPSVIKIYKNSVIATSYSKNLSIPGERIGFIALNPAMTDLEKLTGGMIMCNRILGYVNAPALMQRVIGRMQGITVDTELYKRRRDLLCQGLSSIGYAIEKPEGAFYLFPKTPIEDDVEFVRALQQKNILTVPGSGFGGPGHIRIAYCVEEATITNSMKGFEEVFKEYR
ncbi:MAG: pyridoxal phosphate-dependent aminotransferase, partial [Syntrophaceae bacterium]|nr:pyridoxal phosphate-dependent aminotransferase [Syntrophaceae bacterium]